MGYRFASSDLITVKHPGRSLVDWATYQPRTREISGSQYLRTQVSLTVNVGMLLEEDKIANSGV